MSGDNPLWGAPRIHGELLKLGIDIGETSVGKYIARKRKPPSPTWQNFLENHVKSMVSIDFFTVPTIRFRILYVLLVLAHDRTRIVHFNVTAIRPRSGRRNNYGRHFRSTGRLSICCVTETGSLDASFGAPSSCAAYPVLGRSYFHNRIRQGESHNRSQRTITPTIFLFPRRQTPCSHRSRNPKQSGWSPIPRESRTTSPALGLQLDRRILSKHIA
jgi:hypothetical protein